MYYRRASQTRNVIVKVGLYEPLIVRFIKLNVDFDILILIQESDLLSYKSVFRSVRLPGSAPLRGALLSFVQKNAGSPAKPSAFFFFRDLFLDSPELFTRGHLRVFSRLSFITKESNCTGKLQ